MKYKLAVIDDDKIILKLLVQFLEASGYIVETATDGKKAIQLILDTKPDMVILDWNLPEMNGLQVCQFIRSNPLIAKTPILMLTVFGEMSQKVTAFETGADDYLTKPFDLQELLIRVKALLRRCMGNWVRTDQIIKVGNVQVDVIAHKAIVNGTEIILRPKEFELLTVLLKSPGQLLTRHYLMERIWGYNADEVTTRTVDTHIARLREKLGPQTAKMIKTISSFGYKIEHQIKSDKKK